MTFAIKSLPSTGRTCRAIATCAALAVTICRARMWSRAGSPVKIFQSPDGELGLTAHDPGYGESSLGSLASYDHAMSAWKTCQRSLFVDSTVYVATWPRSGMTRTGALYPLPVLVRRTSASGFSLWPTPIASLPSDGEAVGQWMARRERTRQRLRNGNGFGMPLSIAVRLPTPTTQDAHNNGSASQQERHTPPLNAVAGGPLNPAWVEALMGFPPGWTDVTEE